MPASGLVSVGRVGKPHGLDGCFFVESSSHAAERFAEGATVYVDGVPSRIEVSKQARGRPVIRLDCPAERGAELTVPAGALPELEEDSFYVFQLVGLRVQDADGVELGRVVDVASHPANDVLELDSGLALPLVEACVRAVDLERERIVVAPGFSEPG